MKHSKRIKFQNKRFTKLNQRLSLLFSNKTENYEKINSLREQYYSTKTLNLLRALLRGTRWAKWFARIRLTSRDGWLEIWRWTPPDSGVRCWSPGRTGWPPAGVRPCPLRAVPTWTVLRGRQRTPCPSQLLPCWSDCVQRRWSYGLYLRPRQVLPK